MTPPPREVKPFRQRKTHKGKPSMRHITLPALTASVLISFSGIASAQVSQPHMQAALQDLYAAQQEIITADQYHDHGGFAGNATHRIQQAIHDVRQGIEYRDSHS
jgi:hypothetical protein